jgi:hypothetical protein
MEAYKPWMFFVNQVKYEDIVWEIQFKFDIQVSKSCDSKVTNKRDHVKRNFFIFIRESVQGFMRVL